MSKQDKAILHELGLTQKDIGEALDMGQSSVSGGMNGSDRFFIDRRNKKIIKFLEEQHPGKVTLFTRLTSRELSEIQPTEEAINIDQILSDSTIEDLWWISSLPYFLFNRGVLQEWISNLKEKEITMFFVLPTIDVLIDVYTALKPGLKSKTHSTEMAFGHGELAKFSPDLILVNPSGYCPRIYVRNIAGMFILLSEHDTACYVKNLNSVGLAGSKGEFFSDLGIRSSMVTEVKESEIVARVTQK